MKKTICDKCKSENARTYKYSLNKETGYVDLCMECVQDWVLKHHTKLTEVDNGGFNKNKKSIIYG